MSEGFKNMGKMEQTEMDELNRLRQTAQTVLLEIGQGEVRKARLLGNLDQIETKAHDVMSGAAKRVGIVEGTPWQITKEGDIVQMDQPAPVPAPTQPDPVTP